MSASSTPNAAGSHPPPEHKSTPKASSPARSESASDWIGASLVTAKAISAAGECLPFPYVKVAFELVVILLQTIEVCLPMLNAF
ncbi:hypothetical protein B0H19DRAFT_1104396 [Mycena capillaripes]|nr:hypothetical protein B0H19DRAFT_1104396 [Mycena capillaripes]